MTRGRDPLERRIRSLAKIGLVIALIFGLLPPVGYTLIALGSLRTELAVTGRIRTQEIAQSILRRSRLWMYEHDRFVETLRQMAVPGETLELFTADGRRVAGTSTALDLPVLTIRVPVLVLGEEVATLVVRHSARSLVQGELMAIFLGIALGFGLFVAMRAWPLRTLRRAIAELQAADDSKSLILSAVGHDLRQPLQSLSLFASVIAASDLPPSARRAVDRLNESLHRLGTHLDEIIAIARIDVGGISENRGAIDLGRLFGDLVEELSLAAEIKGVRLRHVPTRAMTEGDGALLATIVRNLLVNAIRYTERGGVVLGCRPRGRGWLICVYDTGIGIAPDKQPRVFDDFYQVDNPERDRAKGLGLGLAIVARLARLLSIEVALRSIPGRGSVFTVAVPRVSGAPRRPASSPAPRRSEGAAPDIH